MESRRLEKRLKERFVKAMATYRLIDDDDRILVGLSGG
jgi:tRNA(Ile)-lysidine synthase TilS/MesJ